MASEKGHKEIVQLLIEKGIDINSKADLFRKKNAFHLASEKGHKEISQLLIEKGKDINQNDLCNIG